MDKEKRTNGQNAIFRGINALLISAIIAVSAYLILNHFSTRSAESVAGTWTGIITDDYAEFIVYDYVVTIEADNHNSFSGTTFAQSLPEYRDVHGETRFIGTIDDVDTISFEDTVIYNNNTGWCKIRATMDIVEKDGVETLIGGWVGLGSICDSLDGRIELTRASK